jgi:hypothetical protein
MSDADREWTIEHAGEQLYDIVILLDYDETSVKIWRPTATDPKNGARLSRPARQASEFGRLSRQRAGV